MIRKRTGNLLLTTLLAAQLLVPATAAERSAQSNYMLRCSGCHGMDGMGVEAAGIPPFPGFVEVFFNDEQSRLYLMHVPGVVGAGLNDAEIAEVMNYVVERWGQPGVAVEHFTKEEVDQLRQREVRDVVALRREITERLAGEGVVLPEYTWP
ncbi:cytochrome c553 [Marinobacter pelagius]|jgi:cytochrome c553|uniref:Cytochrome c553 n=1 Tax=Marinobacter pelagius TaxID=379482 RepID=A0A366FZZ1_9GAMM|nr:cytochrome c [Marinobacter pelagius]RBP19560.1 cytochrome c553 [Marinobacter pelagius]